MQFHWSDLNSLMMCPHRYSLQKLLGPRKPGSPLIVGSGTHDAIEINFISKIETGILLPLSDVKDAARDGVVARVDREGLKLDKEEAFWGRKVTIGKMKDLAISLAALHHIEAAPNIDPISVERKWEIDVIGTPHTLAGRIDIEEEFGIRDTKTIKMSPTQKKADNSDQLTMYGMAKCVLDDLRPEDLSFHFDFLHKLKTPQYKPFGTERTQADVEALKRRISKAFEVIESGIFMPTSRDNWWCSPEWCGYYDVCEYVGR